MPMQKVVFKDRLVLQPSPYHLMAEFRLKGYEIVF